ncbi:hypothetical protein Tco_0130629, partial [Tanacetum coccineum]
GLNHTNFFDEVACNDLGVPCDEQTHNASSQNEGGNSPHYGSPTINHLEDDLGHFHDSNGSASEVEMAVTFEEHLRNYKDIHENIHGPIAAEQCFQTLKRSERASVIPRYIMIMLCLLM